MTDNFRNLNILFLSLLLGQLIFAGVAWFLNQGKDASEASMENADFAFIVPAVLLGGFMGAYLLDKSRTNKAPLKAPLSGKFEHYRTSVIIRAALLEGANLLSVVAFLLTQQTIYLVYFALGLGAFVIFRPTLSQFQQRYHVSAQDLKE